MPRARRSNKRPRSLLARLGLLLAVNIVPLVILAVIAVKYANGEIEIKEDQIPDGVGQTLAWVGGTLLALFLVAAVSLPAAHDGAKAAQGQLRRSGAVMRGEVDGSRFLVCLGWPFFALMALLGGLARFVLILLSFALMGLLGLFLARLKWPDLCQEQIDQVIRWSSGG